MNKNKHHLCFTRNGQPLRLNFQFFSEGKCGEEIETRLTAIAKELDSDSITTERLSVLTKEVDELKTERAALTETVKRRDKLRSEIANERISSPTTVMSNYSINSAHSGDSPEDDDIYSTMAYRKAFMKYTLRGTAMPVEYRAGDVTNTTDVGSVIPTPVLNRIIEKIESVGTILPLVTRTAHKGGLRIPTSSAKPVATWVAEGAGSNSQKKTTGEIIFAYHKLRCVVAVTLEVDTMTISAFENMLINNVVEAMVKALEKSIISGTGTGQPEGILSKTPPQGQTIRVQAPSHDDLLDAFAAVPTAYESNIRWCMTKKTFMKYYGLKDATGQPIGRVDHNITGRPERLLIGIPIVICDYITSFDAADADEPFAFLFNFKDYVLNTNYSVGVKRQENWNTDDMETKAVMLADGKVVDVNSLVILTKEA